MCVCVVHLCSNTGEWLGERMAVLIGVKGKESGQITQGEMGKEGYYKSVKTRSSRRRRVSLLGCTVEGSRGWKGCTKIIVVVMVVVVKADRELSARCQSSRWLSKELVQILPLAL